MLPVALPPPGSATRTSPVMRQDSRESLAQQQNTGSPVAAQGGGKSSPGTPGRISWAAKLHKSLSTSLGIGAQITSDDVAMLRGGSKECLHKAMVDIMMLPHDATAPYTVPVRSLQWMEKCAVYLDRLMLDNGTGSCSNTTDADDRPVARPYALVTHLDRKHASQAKRRMSDDNFPPPIISVDDITAILPIAEDVLSAFGQPNTYACVVEAVVSTQSMFFASQRVIKQCMRFTFREDLVEWVASLKACIALSHCPRDEVPCLHYVVIPSHQRIVSAQHALLVIKPATPRPLGLQLLHPVTMIPLFQVAFRDVSVLGQRMDDKQLWLTFRSEADGLNTDLSLKCQCVAELVKTLKSALQMNLDWGEEIVSSFSSNVLCYKKVKVSVVSGPAFEVTPASPLPPASLPATNMPLIDERGRLPTPECSVSGGESATVLPPLPPKPGQGVVSSLEDSGGFLHLEDKFGEMTEMKSSCVLFAEVPDSVYPSLHPEMMRSVHLSASPPSKYCTMPVMTKSRSQSIGMPDSGDTLLESSRPCQLKRSSSVPSRWRMQGESPLGRLSNRARLLPSDTLDLDEVSLLGDHGFSPSGDFDHTNSFGSAAGGRTKEKRGATVETVYVVPPMAIHPHDT